MDWWRWSPHRKLFQGNSAERCRHFDKILPYRQFCCPVSLISTSSSANIPVSLRIFGEFDRSWWTTPHFEKHSFPVLHSLIATKPLKTDFWSRLLYPTFVARAACVRQRSYTTRHSNSLFLATTCQRVLKHVLKSYDIFCVACDCRKDVLGLIYTTRFVL